MIRQMAPPDHADAALWPRHADMAVLEYELLMLTLRLS
jgi:hypothetical protein